MNCCVTRSVGFRGSMITMMSSAAAEAAITASLDPFATLKLASIRAARTTSWNSRRTVAAAWSSSRSELRPLDRVPAATQRPQFPNARQRGDVRQARRPARKLPSRSHPSGRRAGRQHHGRVVAWRALGEPQQHPPEIRVRVIHGGTPWPRARGTLAEALPDAGKSAQTVPDQPPQKERCGSIFCFRYDRMRSIRSKSWHMRLSRAGRLGQVQGRGRYSLRDRESRRVDPTQYLLPTPKQIEKLGGSLPNFSRYAHFASTHNEPR